MWTNNTFTVTARCEMQKKAEIWSHHVRDTMRPKMMDFPFNPENKKILEIFFHYYWST